MPVSLSGQIIVIVDSSVSGFKGMIQRVEVSTTGSNVCGTLDTDREQCSPIAWSCLAYRVDIHDGNRYKYLHYTASITRCH